MSKTRPIFEYELEEFDRIDEERKNEIYKFEGIKETGLETKEILEIKIRYKKEIIIPQIIENETWPYFYYKYDYKIPGKCGVYILNFDSGERYIGSTTNLKRRIYNHRSMSLNTGKIINCFELYFTDNYSDALYLELSLIKILKPSLNGRGKNINIHNYLRVHGCNDTEKDVQIKSFVNKDVYNIFRGVARLNNKTIKDALTGAMKDWISRNVAKCNHCLSEIGNIYYTKYDKGNFKYYCCVNCLVCEK